MLSCACEPDDNYEGPVYFIPSNYSELKTKKRKRCVSCNSLIDINSKCAIFEIRRLPNSYIEERIYGEGHDVPMASKYMCECCADIFFNLYELGFCIDINDNMNDLLEEYKKMKKESKSKKDL